MKTCLYCGAAIKEARKFCSMKCRDDIRKAKHMRPCLTCGKMFYRVPSHHKRGQFCGQECFGKSRGGDKHHNWKGGLCDRVCVECGKPFRCSKPGIVRCSMKCRNAVLSALVSKPIASQCAECGTAITITACFVGKKRFCSQGCKNSSHSRLMSGSGNPRFLHGQANIAYPAGWTWGFKKRVRRRDGQKCAICGMTRQEHGKAFCVHHINYDKMNIDPKNLITTCRFCHGRLHGKPRSRELWQRILSRLLLSDMSAELLPPKRRSTISRLRATTTT